MFQSPQILLSTVPYCYYNSSIHACQQCIVFLHKDVDPEAAAAAIVIDLVIPRFDACVAHTT